MLHTPTPTGAPLPPLSAREEALLTTFERVPVELLARRQLLQRVDTKFVLSRSWLPELLSELRGGYQLLFAAEHTSARYLTEYYDTPGYDLFHAHRRGKRLRYKVRVRHYPERALSYLEVKAKSAVRGTSKWRRPLGYLCGRLSATDVAFIDDTTPLAGGSLSPVLSNQFRRITLVGVDWAERVTFDVDVQFQNEAGSSKLEGALIAEVKQARLARQSPILRALARRRIRPASASKYCIGSVLLHPELRDQRVRRTLRGLERAVGC
jgi:hypothetical protein